MTTPRLEIRPRPGGATEYYLTASFGVDGRTGNVRKYLGTVEPTSPKMAELAARHRGWFEQTLIDRKAKLSAGKFDTGLLEPSQILKLEEVKFARAAILQYLNPGELEVLRQEFEIDYIHGSTSIEGNTLTKPEVHDLLCEGTLPAGKEAREVFEITNYTKVRRCLEKYAGTLDLSLIQKLHGLLLDNIDHENAGVIRRIDLSIGKRFRGTPPPMIMAELDELLAWYKARRFVLARWREAGRPPLTHPFVQAILFHHRFETIHPFIDGNGRTGREIFNFILHKQGYPRMVFASEDRELYLRALIKGDEDDRKGMVSDLYRLYLKQIPAIIKDPRARREIFNAN